MDKLLGQTFRRLYVLLRCYFSQLKKLCSSVALLKKGRAETRRRKVTKEKFVFIREIRGFFQWIHLWITPFWFTQAWDWSRKKSALNREIYGQALRPGSDKSRS